MDRYFGLEAIPGVAARVYAWATARRAIFQDLFFQVEEAAAAAPDVVRILDVGTGPGFLPIRLARRLPAARLQGVDLSPAMVRLARSAARREGVEGRVIFTQGSASALPFPDGVFDLVVSTLSLHHWRDRTGALRQIHRVLRPGGSAWIYDIRKRIPPEVERWAAARYGRLQAFFFLRVVRLHSFVSDAEARDLLKVSAACFARQDLEEAGLFMRFVLEKQPLDNENIMR